MLGDDGVPNSSKLKVHMYKNVKRGSYDEY